MGLAAVARRAKEASSPLASTSLRTSCFGWQANLRILGSTGDLEERLRRHNAGYSKSTKAGAPVETGLHRGVPSKVSGLH